jgi:hypothetical protein
MATDEVLVHVAGSVVGERGNVDGDDTTTRFHQLLDIAFNPDESLIYGADYGNFSIRTTDPDTGETDTFAVLNASPNCLHVDENGLLWVNTIAPLNPSYVYDVGTPEDPAAEYAVNAKVPNLLDPNPNAMWIFEPDGNLIMWVPLTSLSGDPDEQGAAGSFFANLDDYDGGLRTGSDYAGLQRNIQTGRPYGGDSINVFQPLLATFDISVVDNDLDVGYWIEVPGDPVTYVPNYVMDVREDAGPADCPEECDPGASICSVTTWVRDGHFARNAGLEPIRWNDPANFALDYVMGMSYVYPSGDGVALVSYETGVDIYPAAVCECIDDDLDCGPANTSMTPSTGAVRWSDQYASTDLTEWPMAAAEWGPNTTTSGWQIARGPELDDSPFSCEMGSSMYDNGGVGAFLQTWVYNDPTDIGSPVHRGSSAAPVRGVAYSVSRDAWFFSTAADGTYGTYQKNVNGSTDGYGFHQIMRMVPFVEENPSVDYHMGTISASVDAESDDTLTGIFVGSHIQVHAPAVTTPSGLIDAAVTVGRAYGGVLIEPGWVEPPVLPDPFIPEINPLPIVDDDIQVPLPPWVPDTSGPYRKS